KDTIGLVAHFGGLGTQALLIRFIGGRPTVWLFLAAHEVEHPGLFRINKTDSFSNQLEVPPIRYQLKLSEIPDTTNKQVIFGYIDMESGEYFDKRDPEEEKLKVRMKFYFRSQYRKFDF
ncbi:MAG TPA: hypothetical protein VGB56_01045, partial [Flavisolibacter sp.]